MVGPQKERTIFQIFNLFCIFQEKVIFEKRFVSMRRDPQHFTPAKTDHLLYPNSEKTYFFFDSALTKKKQPSVILYPWPLWPQIFNSPQSKSHLSSRRMFKVSPSQNSLTCQLRTSPNNPTMNSTFALLDLSTISLLKLGYICNLGRDFRVSDTEGSREVCSVGYYQAGGSKMDGTSFNDLRYLLRRSNLSGSMQTRSVQTSSDKAAIKIITKHTPIHNKTHKNPITPFTFIFLSFYPIRIIFSLFLINFKLHHKSPFGQQYYHSECAVQLRHLIYFKQQQMAKSVHTRASLEQHSERQVFYYSKFDLFGKDGEEELLLFSLFTQRVKEELGTDWAVEAGTLYYPYLSSKQLFLNLMELWLRHHPPVNSMRMPQKASTFNPHFIAEFDSLIRGPSGRLPATATVKPAASSLRAVCLGFYMTANQIWQELFQNASNAKLNAFCGGFLKGVTNTIEKTFKPLMVVTQKISNVFGRKRRKLNEQTTQIEPEGEEGGQLKFDDCYQEFRKALDIEKKLQRKMSDFDLEDYELHSHKKQVQKQEFQQSDSPLQPSLVSNLYSYVTGFLNRNPSWQVASNFVTQILDLNQVQLAEGQKVKVLRPAQDFYRKLVIVWLMCQQGSTAVAFEDYLSVLKGTFMGQQWENRFFQPTRYFFQTMKNNWEQIRNQNPSDITQKIALSGFISKIKGCVSEDWQDKIAMRH